MRKQWCITPPKHRALLASKASYGVKIPAEEDVPPFFGHASDRILAISKP
jgi:hypothetical protein